MKPMYPSPGFMYLHEAISYMICGTISYMCAAYLCPNKRKEKNTKTCVFVPDLLFYFVLFRKQWEEKRVRYTLVYSEERMLNPCHIFLFLQVKGVYFQALMDACCAPRPFQAVCAWIMGQHPPAQKGQDEVRRDEVGRDELGRGAWSPGLALVGR